MKFCSTMVLFFQCEKNITSSLHVDIQLQLKSEFKRFKLSGKL